MNTQQMQLKHPDGRPVAVNDPVRSFRGEDAVVIGWRLPLHSGSTGRVITSHGEYYPSVYNLAWENING